ncbi:MAG: hypothetical protein ABSG28_07945 [Methanoregula sp.]|uniref:hypothetical protein n=1 Tax=Methanoregula sp. TaxID=2052170 RepID=UPI003C177973
MTLQICPEVASGITTDTLPIDAGTVTGTVGIDITSRVTQIIGSKNIPGIAFAALPIDTNSVAGTVGISTIRVTL